MNDPHKNIFYYYRGPSKRVQDEIIYDKQVEDNSTKALVNCLDYCTDNLLNHFIKYFDLNINVKGIPQYLLQVSLSKSRPDAQIKFVNSSIYIENKIDAKISKEQLLNHKKELDVTDLLILLTKDDYDKKILNELRIIHIRWSSLFKCFFSYKPTSKSEEFLIEQFINFMEVIGLSDFNGFNNDDFDFFINKIDDYKPIVRNKIEKFGNKVYNSLNDEIRSLYTDKYIGNIPKAFDFVWFGIRKPQNRSNVFRHCNFVISINSEILNFYIVIRDGKFTDKKPIGILYKKIKNNKDEFQELLNSFKDRYYIQVAKRVPRYGTKIMPGNERWVLLSNISLEIVKEETINFLLMLLENIGFPGIRLGINIKRGTEILQKPEELIKFGKEIIEDGYKMLNFLES